MSSSERKHLRVLIANEPGFESPLGAKRMLLSDALKVKPVANNKVLR